MVKLCKLLLILSHKTCMHAILYAAVWACTYCKSWKSHGEDHCELAYSNRTINEL